MKTLCVFITTYKRPELLLHLLTQIKHYGSEYKIHLIIIQDYSEDWEYDYKNCIDYLRFNFDSYHYQPQAEHKGKKKYHECINAGLEIMQGYDGYYDYFFKLDDDQQIAPGFFDDAIRQYQAIMDPRKIALTLINVGREICWTRVYRKPYFSAGYQYFFTQWVDMAFMGPPRFWRCFNYSIRKTSPSWWDKDETRGSGVYRTISKKVVSLNCNIYQVNRSLVAHGFHESKMNPEARQENDLKSIYE